MSSSKAAAAVSTASQKRAKAPNRVPLAGGLGERKAPQAPVPPGSHIATPGPYQEQISSLIKNYPNLQYPSRDNVEIYPHARAAVISFPPSSIPSRTELRNLDELNEHFKTRGQATNSSIVSLPVRDLIILEGLRPDYVAAIGSGLQVDPNIFTRHSNARLWEPWHQAGNTPLLPSSRNSSQSFHLDYRELRYFENIFNSYFVRAAENGRHIAMSSVEGKFDQVGVVDRRASFWSRQDASGGWQALVVVDAPIRDVFVGRDTNTRIENNEPYQGGFSDFIKYSSLENSVKTPGPPRTCMFDDLCHYFEHHPSHLSITSNPASSAKFLKLIIASHYVNLIEYTRGVLDMLESILGRRQNFALQEFDEKVGAFWGDLHHFNRRCQYYQQDLNTNIAQLEICNLHVPTTSQLSPEDGNFLFLKEDIQILNSKSAALFTSFSYLSGISGTRQSLLESRGVFRLSILGIVFLPLSFTSGLFSMSSSYLPGARHFWIYIVVSCCIIIAIFMIPLWHDTYKWLHEQYLKIAGLQVNPQGEVRPDLAIA